MRPMIYIASHRGMVGAAIERRLLSEGVAPDDILTRTHAELDLTNQAAVQVFFAAEKPHQVYLAAARVGGIHANNTYPADFIFEFGGDISIAELTQAEALAVGYSGRIGYDNAQSDDSPRKLMDSSRLNHMSGLPKVNLAERLVLVYQDFKQQVSL